MITCAGALTEATAVAYGQTQSTAIQVQGNVDIAKRGVVGI